MESKMKVFWGMSLMAGMLFLACQSQPSTGAQDASNGKPGVDTLKASLITDSVAHDSDDPAIWVNPKDASKSLIIGTDKDRDGAIYAFDLTGKVVKKVEGIMRPNNVDIAYGLNLNGNLVDIAVFTERGAKSIRVFSLPELAPIDGGGIPVFVGEAERAPMGIALYTRPNDHAIFAIVGRKSGPAEGYLWQYKLSASVKGTVQGEVVRKFGKYSGKKEIEAIAVDNELGFVYYSDEQEGVRKYLADPAMENNEELALFAQEGFSEDHEGIAIYKTSDTTGYLIVSNQGSQSLMVYPREGTKANNNSYPLLAEIPSSAMETDGLDATAAALGTAFPKGILVAMSTDKTFHIFDWRMIQERLTQSR